MTTKEIFTEARALIAKGWTQRTFAENALRTPCESADIEAERWSLIGAISQAAPDKVSRRAAAVAIAIIIPRPGPFYELVDWNDEPGRTQEEVLDLLTKAIAACEER